MSIVAQALVVLAAVGAVVLLLGVSLLYLPLRWRPVGLYFMAFKLGAVAFAPLAALAAAALTIVGVLVGSWWIGVPAAAASVGACVATIRIGAVSPDLASVFGAGREERIPVERRRRMISRWWRGRVSSDAEPQLQHDVAFATVGDRTLLCDVWSPPAGTALSGVAVVYLHGSAYSILDKDVGTRPLFRHFVAQGHVVVDVAYRLFPESDVPGMAADAKRAVAWVRNHAADLGIDPDLIVLAGGSAGGHLALLAGYSREDPALTPPELAGSDPAVRAVVSLYGQVDLAAMYEHTSQAKVCHPDDPQPDWDAGPAAWMQRRFGADAGRLRLQFMTVAGRCDWLMGGTPSEVPERYAVVSALEHVHADCPVTLLIHGTHDEMAPVSAVRELDAALDDVGVPVVAVVLPHTDHMFDLVGMAWSPPARTALHVLERFLALLAAGADRTTDLSVDEETGRARLQSRSAANDRAVELRTFDREAG